jgi:hypothetical protein
MILGDDEQWKPDEDIPFKLLVGDVGERQDLIKEWTSHRRLLFDIRADHSEEVTKRFMSYVDVVLWCIRPQDARAAVHLLQVLVKSVPRWREKLRVVWLLDSNTPMAPYVPELYELVERDLKLSLDAPGANQGNLMQHGFDRIVHHLLICEASKSVWHWEAAQLAVWLVLECSKRLSNNSTGVQPADFVSLPT